MRGLVWGWGIALLLVSGARGYAADACFDQVQNRALRAYSAATLEPKQRLAGVRNTCRELSPGSGAYDRYTSQSYTEQSVSLLASWITAAMGRAIGAFATMRDSEHQRSFAEELATYKGLTNRYDRIHGAYDLVSRYQGAYDHYSRGLRTDFSGFLFGALRPGHLVDSGKESGTAGVCRHIAALLYWSLLQVARAPDSTNQALGPNDFSPDYILARTPDREDVWNAHAWVRVNLPEREEGVLRFHSLDLDSDLYRGELTFLPPRREHAELTEIDRDSAECQAALRCLEKSPAPDEDFPAIVRGLGRTDMASEGFSP